MTVPMLLSPIDIGPVRVRNRIASSGHATRLADGQRASPRFIAYHRARAAGGVGLIITEATMLLAESAYSGSQLVNVDDSIIPSFQDLTAAIHAEGAVVFGQLLHLGLEQMANLEGHRVAAAGPSAGTSERYHVAGRSMTEADIAAVVAAFGDGADRMKRGGYDGVEVAASHGYLIAQFLSERINRRTDRYGGSFDNRLRLAREILTEVRARVGPDIAVGMRISSDELTVDGLTADEVIAITTALATDGLFDYVNVAIGSSTEVGAAVHIVSPMSTDMAISADVAAQIRAAIDQPVLAVGRINTPRQAEQVLAEGRADLCGMTRALICDPEMPNKAAVGDLDGVRVCIACNQACIDRFHRGIGISCIQHPETGRELTFGLRIAARTSRRVLVVGGGPAGLKAASVAAERGHEVQLFEAAPQLGGQALLAEQLPRRGEFGGIVENLSREAERAGVDVRVATKVDRALVDDLAPDAVVVATGAVSRVDDVGEIEAAHVVDAWDAIRGGIDIGKRVLVADWRCDWIGIGLAEMLADARHDVVLASTGYVAGETIPRYVRDHSLGELHRRGVRLEPLVRFYGADDDTVYLQHIASGLPVIIEGIDTVVMARGHVSVNALVDDLVGFDGDVHAIGDCLAPRTAEEAVYEGLEIGVAL